MKFFKSLVTFVGRVFISLFFIITSLEKIFDWQVSGQKFVSDLALLHSHLSKTSWGTFFIEAILPFATTLLTIIIIFELVGGFLLLIGIRVRLGAFLLIVVLIFTTLLSHYFWVLEGEQRSLQLIQFLKNLAILGGLLNVIAFGKGDKPKKAAPSQ